MRVLRNWYQKFRVKLKFQISTSKKHDFPPFLERNKEMCIAIKTYTRENLAKVSSEMLCQYLHDTFLSYLAMMRAFLNNAHIPKKVWSPPMVNECWLLRKMARE
jgi:hypothetical protein